jgi:benzoate transport
MDVTTAIKKSAMSRFQYIALFACLLIITIDGYDVFVMGFTLPHLPEGFFTDTAQKGYLLSAGLAGMAAGSILLAPLSDRFGRRALILGCLVICCAGLILSAVSPNVESLIAARIITGVGIGGMAASLVVLVQEYTNDRYRTLILGIYSIGFPLGSLLGGSIGVMLVNTFDGAWQVMFIFGAVITALAVLIALKFMPESIDYLVAGSPRNAQAKIDIVIAQLKMSGIDRLARPVVPEAVQNRGSFRGLFVDGMYKRTLLTWVMYAGLMSAFYFANTWTPQLITSATNDINLGTTAGLILSLGGFLGAIAFGIVSIKVDFRRLAWICMILAGVSVLAFSVFFTEAAPALILTTVLGTFTYMAITGTPAIVSPLYPVKSRATAMGWMIGIGRLFSIGAPIAVGYALAAFSPESLYAASSVPLFMAGAATFMLWRMTRGTRPDGSKIQTRETAVLMRRADEDDLVSDPS